MTILRSGGLCRSHLSTSESRRFQSETGRTSVPRRGREPTRPLAVSILMASRTAVRLILSSDDRAPSFGRLSLALKRPETISRPRRFTSSTVMFPEPKLPNARSALGMSLLAYGLIPRSSSVPQVPRGGAVPF
jgi:hypothetical protein